MFTNRAVLRFTTALAVAGLLRAQILPPAAFAQPAQPPAVPGADSRVITADPPARAGRLARITGNVAFHPAEADRWDRAVLNYPITGGYSFWTDTGAEADIEVAASRLVIDSQTQIDVTTLDASNVVVVLPHGEVYLRLRSLVPGETYTLQTPRGSVTISTNGRYAIFAGDTSAPTRITVLEGFARVTGPDIALDIGPNQAGLIEGTANFVGHVAAAEIDDFTRAQLDRERPPSPQAAVPPAVRAMPGGEELSAYGSWDNTSRYGQVWYPRVDADWRPYRDGHWAWVAPWGWTWVDDAPWGFAPSHYGRWVQVDDRWGWAPGFYDPGVAYVQPVYAPALVSFFDFGAGVAVGLGVGLAFGGNIGWCPLGWGEPFRPWFPTSNNFIVNVNIHNVQNINITNITAINSNVTINNFANRRSMTAMPMAAMANSAQVSRFAQPVDARRLETARPVIGHEPFGPAARTLGVSAGLARRMQLPEGPADFAGRREAARGPEIGTGAAGASRGSLPPLAGTGHGGFGHAGAAGMVGSPAEPAMRGQPMAPALGGRNAGPDSRAGAGFANPGHVGLPPLAEPGGRVPRGLREGGSLAAPTTPGSQFPALQENRRRALEPGPAVRGQPMAPALGGRNAGPDSRAGAGFTIPGHVGSPPLAEPGGRAARGLRDGGSLAAPTTAGSQFPVVRENRRPALAQPDQPPADRGFQRNASPMDGRLGNSGRLSPAIEQPWTRQAMPPRYAPQDFGQRSHVVPQMTPPGYERPTQSYAVPRSAPRQDAMPQYGGPSPRQFSAPRRQQVIPQGDGGPPSQRIAPMSQGGAAFRQSAPRQDAMPLSHGGGGHPQFDMPQQRVAPAPRMAAPPAPHAQAPAGNQHQRSEPPPVMR